MFDPRDLNEALEREPYHTRFMDEITTKLQGMNISPLQTPRHDLQKKLQQNF